MKKNVLVVSFDLIRSGEANQSLSIATLMAYAKADHRYGNEFSITHYSINMLELSREQATSTTILNYIASLNTEQYSMIAISCYVWCEYLINPFIKALRQSGYKNAILLGGYQISYSNLELLHNEYADCQFFVNGYGEKALVDAIFMKMNNEQPRIISEAIDFTAIPSAYINGAVHVEKGQRMVRIETKRGCPYRCSFCAHRDLKSNKIYLHPLEKVFQELAFFKEKEVQKINVLDPVFNVGHDYLQILEEAKRIKLSALLSLQSKIELIISKEGTHFLDLCSQLNVHLEFGIQTIHENEYKVINRLNDIEKIKKAMCLLKERNISYEISIIYGLPNQTVSSFSQTIDLIQSYGCQNLTAYPLMLLKGTELYAEKEKWNFTEKAIGDFNIPVVVSSNSFTEDEWQKMNEIADGLMNNQRF